ncbi:MAG: hypothetical protein IPG71_13445 [bacterium]|nr:hypothetical protein [bacterium]
MKILGIVVARRGSERLPGKVLRELAGEPMLLQVLARAARSKCLHELVVALPDSKQDDTIESLCSAHGYFCFRGSEMDLLDRVFRTAIAYGADIVVPLRANCPLVDGELIDLMIDRLLQAPDADWATNRLPSPTYPIGLEVDVIRIEALRKAWMEDTHPGSRQHIDSFFMRRPDLFVAVTESFPKDCSHVPWQVASLPDLDRVRRIYEKLGDRQFRWQEALAVWLNMPEEAAAETAKPGALWHSAQS